MDNEDRIADDTFEGEDMNAVDDDLWYELAGVVIEEQVEALHD